MVRSWGRITVPGHICFQLQIQLFGQASDTSVCHTFLSTRLSPPRHYGFYPSINCKAKQTCSLLGCCLSAVWSQQWEESLIGHPELEDINKTWSPFSWYILCISSLPPCCYHNPVKSVEVYFMRSAWAFELKEEISLWEWLKTANLFTAQQ